MCGVYRNREDAIKRARKYADSSYDIEAKQEQNEAAPGISNRKLFHDPDGCWAVAIEMLGLDPDHDFCGDQIDVSCSGSNVWYWDVEMEFY